MSEIRATADGFKRAIEHLRAADKALASVSTYWLGPALASVHEARNEAENRIEAAILDLAGAGLKLQASIDEEIGRQAITRAVQEARDSIGGRIYIGEGWAEAMIANLRAQGIELVREGK